MRAGDKSSHESYKHRDNNGHLQLIALVLVRTAWPRVRMSCLWSTTQDLTELVDSEKRASRGR